jgi:hypothetical protein
VGGTLVARRCALSIRTPDTQANCRKSGKDHRLNRNSPSNRRARCPASMFFDLDIAHRMIMLRRGMRSMRRVTKYCGVLPPPMPAQPAPRPAGQPQQNRQPQRITFHRLARPQCQCTQQRPAASAVHHRCGQMPRRGQSRSWSGWALSGGKRARKASRGWGAPTCQAADDHCTIRA